jgi:hypothetical protein
MPRPVVRPAQNPDFHALQAMASSGVGHSCYPSFVRASHTFFVAQMGSSIVGFICAYPTQDHRTNCVHLLKPYLYAGFEEQGIEDDLKAAVLKWAEEKLDVHFFKDNAHDLHPIQPHEYIESLKYTAHDLTSPESQKSLTDPASQPVYIPAPQRAYG